MTISTPNAGSSMTIGAANGGGLFGTNVGGNFHIDSDKTGNDGRIYLDYFNGKGVVFGNGNGGVSGASVDTGGNVTATTFNGLKLFAMTCTQIAPNAALSCEQLCPNPSLGSCNTSAKGSCVAARLTQAPIPEAARACGDFVNNGPGGGSLTAKCICGAF